MLESILTTYGYPAIILGTFLEGETVMILAGVAAHMGFLSLDWIIVCGFCGTFFGDQLYFFLGRRHGRSMLAKRPSWQTPADQVFDKLERHQILLMLSFRFLYGIRTVTPFAIGMSDISYLRFAFLNFIGAGIWAVTIAFAGYYFGQAVETVLGDIKHYEIQLIAGIVGFSVFIWVIHFYRQRANKSA